MGEKALIETQLPALLNICKAEEVDDRVDLAVVHLPGSLSYSFHQHLGLPRAIFTKENPNKMQCYFLMFLMMNIKINYLYLCIVHFDI